MGIEEMLAAAEKKMGEASTGGSPDGTWHRWSDDSTVAGTYLDRDSFTRQDGTTADYVRINTGNGVLKVGMDYAVLKSQWSDADPQPGDSVLIMRGVEKVTSQSGREYWPFVVVKESGQGELEVEPKTAAGHTPSSGDDEEIPF